MKSIAHKVAGLGTDCTAGFERNDSSLIVLSIPPSGRADSMPQLFGVRKMPIQLLLTFSCAVALSLTFIPIATGQTVSTEGEKNGDDQPSIKLHVAGNLVVVRVAVRNSRGEPVLNLRKEDFRVYDNGKEQPITQFDAEAPSKEFVPSALSEGIEQSRLQAIPRTFLALYFDDLSMIDAQVVYARDAGEGHIRGNLHPGVHVGIFTATGEPQSDFTDNLQQLHDVLFRVRSSPGRSSLQPCPELSDYEAQEIVDHPNPRSGSDAWRVALDEVNAHCPVGPERVDIDTVPMDVVITVRDRARSIAAQAEFRARSSLAGLQSAVEALSQVSGRRSLIMLSPGFLSSTLRPEFEAIINQALQSEVVINSVDPKGMFMLSSQANAGRNTVPWDTAQRNRLASDLQGQNSGSSVLAELAEATGASTCGTITI